MAEKQPTTNPSEQWRDIPGWENQYQVSNMGNVRSLTREIVHRDGVKRVMKGRNLTSKKQPSGHLWVQLWENGKYTKVLIHRIVLEAFIGAPGEGMIACHENGEPTDNRVENLRWDTPSSNMKDRVRHGTCHESNKTHCPRGHELKDPNLAIAQKRKGHRACLACQRAHNYVYGKPALKPYFQEISDSYHEKIISSVS